MEKVTKDLFLSSLSKWKIDELRDELSRLNLSTTGSKSDLVASLQLYYRNTNPISHDEADLSETHVDTQLKQEEELEEQSGATGYTLSSKQPEITEESKRADGVDTSSEFRRYMSKYSVSSEDSVDTQREELEALQMQLQILEMKQKIRRLTRESIQEEDSQSASSSSSEIKEMVKLVQKSVDNHSIAPAEPSVFDGNTLDYPRWKTRFTLLVINKDFTPQQKLIYLEKYLSGRALKCVQGYFMLNTPQSFDRAMQLLDSRFGDPFVVADTFRDKLEAWSKVPPNDGEALRDYSDFLQQCVLAMESISQLSKLDDPREIKRFVNTLPRHLIGKWSEKAGSLKLQASRYPTFTEYAEFVKLQALLACDSVTSIAAINAAGKKLQPQHTKSAVSHNAGAQDKTPDARKLQDTTQDKMTPPSSNPKTFCYKCPDSTFHSTANCRDVGKLNYEDLQNFLKENNLCFRCAKKGHSVTFLVTKFVLNYAYPP